MAATPDDAMRADAMAGDVPLAGARAGFRGYPSRRRALHLLLGGCAATLAPSGLGFRLAQGRSSAPDGLPRSRPEDQGLSPTAILGVLDEVDRSGFELHSFMLWRNGHVVAEGWWSPYRADRVHKMHSVTKSVAACGVGLALAEKRFTLQDKAVSFFRSELPDRIDDKLAAMTVEDLLTMRTGHAHMTSGAEWRRTKTDWVAEFFRIPVVFQPGTKFVYTSAATFLLSAIVTRVTGQPLADYLKPRLFEPLDITGYDWPLGPNNLTPGGNGLSWKTVDSLKLGVLQLQNGRWNGRQVLPADWVATSHAPHVDDRYGYHWWLGPGGAYYAAGLFSQTAFVFPAENIVLATTAGIPVESGFPQLVFAQVPKMIAASTARDDRAFKALAAHTASLQLIPVPAPTTSPMAPQVSAKTYRFPDNGDGVRSIRLTFHDGGCTFALTDDRGTHRIEVGLGHPVEGDTTMTGYKLHHDYQPDRMRVVASGTWRDARTLVMTWTFVECAFRDTVVCVFEGPYMRFSRSVNVNAGPIEMPTLVGRLEMPQGG